MNSSAIRAEPSPTRLARTANERHGSWSCGYAHHPPAYPARAAPPAPPAPVAHRWARHCLALGWRRMWLMVLAAMAALVIAGTVAGTVAEAADEPGSKALPLAENRWSELAYGLSLRPWATARMMAPPPPGMLAQFVDEGFQLRVFVREAAQEVRAGRRDPDAPDAPGALEMDRPGAERTFAEDAPRPIEIETVREWAPRRVAFTNPDARVLEDESMQIAGRPGARLVYRIPSADSLDPDSVWARALHRRLVGGGQGGQGGDWVLGQAFMQIDPYTVVRFELNADVNIKERALATFDAVLASVELTDPRELDEHRRRWIEAGQHWLRSVDRAQRHEQLIEHQWLRITKDGKDIGYKRIAQQQATELGRPGIRIEITERLYADGAVYDNFGEYFEADDGLSELWSVRAARRTQRPRGRLPDRQMAGTQAAAETGLRAGQTLTVSNESRERLDQEEWPRLPQTYLSQVDLHLLPRLLPRDEQTTLAFYAYHSNTAKVALRIVRVVPLPEGGFRVYQRPTPQHGEQVATYDEQGRLVQQRMPDGRVFLVSDERTIREIWRER